MREEPPATRPLGGYDRPRQVTGKFHTEKIMRLWGIVLVALTTLSTSAVAAKDFKVAYVDSSRIMREVKDAKKAKANSTTRKVEE